jgi:hypothetical protein
VHNYSPGKSSPPHTQIVTYIDNMNESFADTDIGKVTPVLTVALGLTFAPDKPEVIHLSMATKRETKFPEELIISSVDPPLIIPAQ